MMRMRFTVEETNLLSIYDSRNKNELIRQINAVLPLMEADMRELAMRTVQKINMLTEEECATLSIYAAGE